MIPLMLWQEVSRFPQGQEKFRFENEYSMTVVRLCEEVCQFLVA
jgi:hypothetical protein